MFLEHSEVAYARDIWSKTKDPKLAISAFPSRFYAERRLLEGLIKHGPTNYVNSLSMVRTFSKSLKTMIHFLIFIKFQIPRHLRLMYVHSYQSYVWNRLVSKRFQKFGNQVVPGDLILVEESNSKDHSSEHLEVIFDQVSEQEEETPEAQEVHCVRFLRYFQAIPNIRSQFNVAEGLHTSCGSIRIRKILYLRCSLAFAWI